MPPKRKASSQKKAAGGGPAKKRMKPSAMMNLAKKAAQSVFMKQVETKNSVTTSTDGVEISHNNFVVMDTNLLGTSQGVGDPMATGTDNRIGDEINLRGVSIKFMVELNERYADVTFRMFVVKKAKGDTLNSSTFFRGVSGNKMLDTINTERFTVIASKTFKLLAPGFGRRGGAALSLNGSGIDGGTDTGAFVTENAFLLSRATKIVKLYIPGSKIKKNRKIVYENSSTQPKFFDYQVILYAYSNYSTSTTEAWNVGRLNDYIRTLYYTDS